MNKDAFGPVITPYRSIRPEGLLTYLAVAILGAAYLFPCVRTLSDGGDEGISVLNAARVLQGEMPARDFVEVVGPGEFYWLASFFKLFGTSITTAHFELLLVGVVFSILAFHLAQRAGGDPMLSAALITVVSIPLFAMNSYHWDSNLFSLLSLTALVEWQRRSRLWLLMLAGLLAGAATLIMQQKGFLLCGGLLLSAVLIDRSSWKKSCSGILIAYLAVLLSVAGFYAAHGALHDLVWANIIWPVFHYSTVNKCPYASGIVTDMRVAIGAFTSTLPGYIGTPLAVFSMLPKLAVVALPGLLALLVCCLRKKAFPPRLIPFWICGAALYLGEWQRPDVSHLLFGCPILLLVLGALLRGMVPPPWVSGVAALSITLFAGAMLLTFLAAGTRIETRRGPIYARHEKKALEYIQDHTRPGDQVLVYPYRPLYNFLSDTRNPTRFSYFVYGLHTPSQFAEAIADLESKSVRYVLLDTSITADKMQSKFVGYHAPALKEQVMERYLESRYREVAFEGDYRILERIPVSR